MHTRPTQPCRFEINRTHYEVLDVPKIETIARVVAAHFGLLVSDIMAKKGRYDRIAVPRMFAVYSIHKFQPLTTSRQIAKFFGYRDRSTISASITTMRDYITIDDWYRRTWNELYVKINNSKL